VKERRTSLYYFFESSAKRLGSADCIWSREGSYSWTEAYDRVNQYGQWYLSQGVKPHELVALYLQNSPDFIFAWLGLWSIGAAPAMINYNLAGKALLHCLKISGAKTLLADSDAELMARTDEISVEMEAELGMRRIVLDQTTLAEIKTNSPVRPDDTYRDAVEGDWPICLFYTR
jgi:acyl-CoA synthetase (AMP-forming)/AMP-acid ligase II